MVSEKNAFFIAGFWLVLDAFASILYSTDQIFLFQVGRIIRLVIGLLLLINRFPKNYYKAAGAYLALEGLGSILISPDQDALWQAGRVGRVVIGAWLFGK